jgi:hypothetical protein
VCEAFAVLNFKYSLFDKLPKSAASERANLGSPYVGVTTVVAALFFVLSLQLWQARWSASGSALRREQSEEHQTRADSALPHARQREPPKFVRYLSGRLNVPPILIRLMCIVVGLSRSPRIESCWWVRFGGLAAVAI